MNTFHFPTRIRFGEGVLSCLAEELARLGADRPLVVTDQGLLRTDIPGQVTEQLTRSGLLPALFTEVAPNPKGCQVEAGAEAFLEHGADGIVALGGGSPMDAAKAVQLRIHHHEPLEVYDDLKGGDARIDKVLPPLVAVPTTAGTGSEVSRSAVITLDSEQRKVVLFSPRLMPSVAVCDPVLTRDLPTHLTAETGMDVLSHAVEPWLAPGYHPMADAIALDAVARVGRFLPRAVADGHDMEARREMMMASTMGGVAFQKGLGAVHSLAHALGAVVGLGHGLANAVLLPHVMRFNAEVVPERVLAVARSLTGEPAAGIDEAVERITGFASGLGITTCLGPLGVDRALLDTLADKALEDGCHNTNPRPLTRAAAEEILTRAL